MEASTTARRNGGREPTVVEALLSSTTIPEPVVGFVLVSSKTIDLTPDVVHEFRTLPPSPTDRARSEGRVKHLREKADNGLLTSFFWAIGILNGKRFRLNGQHSSEMLDGMITDGKFPAGLKVHFDEYDLDDLDAAARLFRQFDDRRSGRSPADVSGVYQTFHNQLAGVPLNIGKLGVEAISWFRQFIEGLPVSRGDDRYTLFGDDEIHPFLTWIGEMFAVRKRHKEMVKMHVVAAMYGSFIANPEAAREFWTEVQRGGNETNETAPTTLLSAWLTAAHENRDRDIKGGNIYQACVYAWNAFRENRAITTVRFDAKKSFYKISH